MTNLIAIVNGDIKNLETKAKLINNGRTDNTYFYVNDSKVSVSNCYFQLSIESQKEELTWFLNNVNHTFQNIN